MYYGDSIEETMIAMFREILIVWTHLAFVVILENILFDNDILEYMFFQTFNLLNMFVFIDSVRIGIIGRSMKYYKSILSHNDYAFAKCNHYNDYK